MELFFINVKLGLFYLKDRSSTENVWEISLEEKNLELKGIWDKQRPLVNTEQILI